MSRDGSIERKQGDTDDHIIDLTEFRDSVMPDMSRNPDQELY